jgi:hypothetical protein
VGWYLKRQPPHPVSRLESEHRLTNDVQQYSSIVYRNFDHPTPKSLAARLSGDLQETIVTKNYVLVDVILKTAHSSVAAMAFVFVSMLFLTTLHP